MGLEVTVTATLKNYEDQTHIFKIDVSDPNVSKIMMLKKKAPVMGSIQVNAVPWGRVQIQGYIQGKETPVHRNNIPEGRYQVTVNNPLLKKQVGTVALIRGGRTTRCDADFEGKASFRCR
jgi:hypothetical protein